MIDRRLFCLAALAAPLAGCGGGRDRMDVATPGDAAAPYTLGPGDKLRITVYGEQTLTGEYAVTGAGNISFPLIGNVPAAGRTIENLQTTIRARLASGYISDPRVSAEVLSYRPFYILGQVEKPGQYPFSIGLTLEQAVAAAGGFTYRANTKKIYVKRANGTGEMQVNTRRGPPFLVQPGDTIRVGERFF